MNTPKKGVPPASPPTNTPNSILSQMERFEQAYMERFGLHLFPIKWLDKTPITEHGCLDAVNGMQAYEALHGGRPHNVAMATGAKSGVWVLDIDPRHGGQESYREMVQTHGPFPTTWEVYTQSGGLHVYFRWDTNRPVNNRANILPGIDVRGEGGYVLLPPSKVEGSYEWICSPSQAALADAPDWLYDIIGAEKDPGGRNLAYLADGAIDGHRNVTVTELSGMLLGRGFPVKLAWVLVDSYNQQYVSPPLEERELLRTFQSIAGREINKRQRRNRRFGA